MKKIVELITLYEERDGDYSIDMDGNVHLILGNREFCFHKSNENLIDEILDEIKKYW